MHVPVVPVADQRAGFVTGLVLAAGAAQRLGRPKQLLAYAGTTLLGASLDTARSCGFDQLIVTLGGSASAVRASVDLRDCEVVENLEYATGCSSSISSAVAVVDRRAIGLVLLLGDQPEISRDAVRALIEAAPGFPLGVCRYADAVGHPFWFGRAVFAELLTLHGDKGVWKLLESGRHEVIEVDVPGPVPRDVDTWEDYQALLAGEAAQVPYDR
jgi:molybdenum cofactor cytidylyltransferase